MRAQLMEREIFISEVANNAKVLNRTINDDDLLRFVVEEVVDRCHCTCATTWMTSLIHG